MSKNKTIEQMKKIIEEKKKVSAQQGAGGEVQNKEGLRNKDQFKSIKRGGSLNK